MLILRTVFLSLHAASGVLGLLIGIFAFAVSEGGALRPWAVRAYAGTLFSLAIFLIATVGLDWTQVSVAQQAVFGVLIGLAIVIVTRIILALRAAAGRAAVWQEKYLNHVYFTYISLWEGFFIVGLLDLGAPGWLVAGVAIGVLILGGVIFNNYKRRSLVGAPSKTAA